jgi:hypothetical protein
MSRLLTALVVGVALSAAVYTPGAGQGAQAAQGIREAAQADERGSMDSSIAVVAEKVGRYKAILVGAAVGAAFDALGSAELKEYFTKNVSASAT